MTVMSLVTSAMSTFGTNDVNRGGQGKGGEGFFGAGGEEARGRVRELVRGRGGDREINGEGAGEGGEQ